MQIKPQSLRWCRCPIRVLGTSAVLSSQRRVGRDTTAHFPAFNSFARRKFHSTSDHIWPTVPDASPYDVLNLPRSGTYSKRRYFELVKLYHPDLPCNGHPACKGLTETERAHRYRLVVAAHEILSDPVKRSAFDRFGDHWYGRPELFGINSKRWHAKHRRANAPDPSVYRNATWEDWEKYYQRRSGNPPNEATRASKESFASLVIMVALLIGVTQAITIGRWSFYEDRAKEHSQKNAQFLEARKRSTLVDKASHDTRIKEFLIARDPSGLGLKDDEADTYRQQLKGSQGGVLSIGDIERVEKARLNSENDRYKQISAPATADAGLTREQ